MPLQLHKYCKDGAFAMHFGSYRRTARWSEKIGKWTLAFLGGLDLLVDLVSALLDWDRIVAQGLYTDNLDILNHPGGERLDDCMLSILEKVSGLDDIWLTPIGGLPHYGVVKEDYLMIKGCLRQSLSKQTSCLAIEVVVS
ncbi:hypothetical protein IFM89_035942 [Coptis chinensis]|uniref:Uncharacterized protein n=1 Tax=Coptis chinensis TaxID=261450 RepID=A0A835H046_9MAGN|nr:hypothetical protein IFM89_035942 [Coptis chinensis]